MSGTNEKKARSRRADPAQELVATKACHCLAARRRARALTRFYEEKLRPHGLKATQFSILAVLSLKGPTRLGELAEILGLERTTLTRGAAILVERGWITETPSRDARERRFRITAAGRRKIEAAYPAWKEAQDAVDAQSAGDAPAGERREEIE